MVIKWLLTFANHLHNLKSKYKCCAERRRYDGPATGSVVSGPRMCQVRAVVREGLLGKELNN